MALILNVTIQTKATEQYFPMKLFITLYKVALTFESEDEILSVTIQMKATKPYFLRHCLFRCTLHCGSIHFLYKIVLTFETVDEKLKFNRSNESNWAMLSCHSGAVYYSVQKRF